MGIENAVPALLIALLLAACTDPTSTAFQRPLGIPGATPTPRPAATPGVAPTSRPTPAPTASPTGRVLYGLAALRTITGDYFRRNQAYGLLNVPLGGGLVTVTTLEQALVAFAGQAISTVTDADGRFKIADQLPTAFSGVAAVGLAGGHRVSALILSGSRDLTLDEASSMVVELARWQAPPATVAAWPPAALQEVYQRTLTLVKPGDLAAGGDPPVIETLQAGAGLKLRNRYLALLGPATTPVGTTDADVLSDTWRGLMGFRPLAVTTAAGGGPEGEDALAPRAALAGPTDALPDALGNVWLADHDAHLIRVIAAVDRLAWLARSPNLTAGRLYTLLGTDDGPKTAEAYEGLYAPLEQAAVTNPDAAPRVLGPAFPLFAPRRLTLEPGDADVPTVFFASDQANRVFWIPAKDATRFGRRVRGGRLYTLATGTRPVAIALDAVGDLIVLDAAGLRVARATDGKLVPLVLQAGGAALDLKGAQDFKLVGGMLYVADTQRHVVWKAPLPAGDRALQLEPLAPLAAEAVLGQPDKPGQAPPPATLYAANDGVARADALLREPDALTLTASGQLIVSDGGNQRLRLLDTNAKVYSIGGAFVTPPGAAGSEAVLEGDARLAAFPGTSSLVTDAQGDVLLADRRAHVVRRLHTRRGVR
ncbi:MAG: Glucose/arabinose dehydrogenase, beta-propeller fold [Cyanobacteria bacterium RYN_339]|nr:Glucose/arabinose dehydrogenase, beta-propeller fold [Cyanobacteria bacterium RYN_339]